MWETQGCSLLDLWQERPYCKILSESRNRAALGKLQSLSGKSLPREGRRHVEAQTDHLTFPSLSVTCGVSYSVKGVVGVVAIAFVVDTVNHGHLARVSWCGYTPQLFLVVDPESYTILGKDPLRSWNDWARPRTKSKTFKVGGKQHLFILTGSSHV